MTAPTPSPAFRDEPAAWEAVARWLDGRSPPPEADAVLAWLAADPARAALVHTLGGDVLAAAGDAPPVDVEAALRGVQVRMEDAEPASAAPASPPVVVPFRARRAPPPRGWTGSALRIAAVLVLALGGALLVSRVQGPRGAPAAAYATGVGQRRTVDLADGTRVLLGPASRLGVAAGYGGRSRDVALDGEALFDVPHDASRPFTVRAGDAVIRDLGTRFAVRAAADAGVSVVVTGGSVRLQAKDGAGGVVLARGERGEVRPGAPAAARRGRATDDDLAWTAGRLVFRDAPLDEVSAELERWYGVRVRTADPAFSRRTLTASFAGEAPRDVVRVVAMALGAEVTMRGDTAYLRAAGAVHGRP
jgi:transmembrane sensor